MRLRREEFFMKRRDFIAMTLSASAVVGAVGCSSSSLSAQTRASAETLPGDRRAEAKLRIGSQLRGWVPGKTEEEKMAQLKKWGMDAVEPSSSVVPHAKEYKKKADDAGLKVAVICGGTDPDALSSPDPQTRQKGIDSVKRSLEAAAILECNGIIYVPSFNHQYPYKNMGFTEIRKMLIETDANSREIKSGLLKELGELAVSFGTNVILEPLNRKEAWFLRQVGDAAAICRDAKSDGVKTMGDLYHMFYEENSNMGAFISGGRYVRHVHLGCGNARVLPGQAPEHSRDDFVSAFRGLKYIGYEQFMCFECGCLGGDEKGVTEVPKTLDFLRQCWEEA